MAQQTFINDDFLGKGWSFPPTFNITTKSVEVTEKQLDIQRSLEILLTTTVGERVMEPKYGCNMTDLLFEPLNTNMKTTMIDRIQTAILYFEPRIDAKNITLDTADELEGVILIQIEYAVRATNSRFNFVYPYYIDEGTEIQQLTTNTQIA
ncbi:MAG TPA: GPW/gp25 family protein [Mucilaginibacter sp.]